MIMVRESGDAAPDVIECRHGLTPPMRDARKRRFRREPDLNPELVSRVEKDLLKIIAGGTADNLDILSSQLFNLVNFIKLSLKLMVVEILLVDYPSYLLCPYNKFVYLTWGSRDNP
ncbi:transcription initiation factor TFIID subunit 7, variant 3 [Lathyrus oleraceus]|nr:transcription initiation factor TFIID subunit 7, variant 3 [Pisum sativum]